MATNNKEIVVVVVDKKHRYGTLKRLLHTSRPEFGRIVTGIIIILFIYIVINNIFLL